MIVRSLFILIIICLFQQKSMAQKSQRFERSTNSLYLNFLGRGSLVGIDFDKIFYSRKYIFLSAQVGMGINTISEGMLSSKKEANCLVLPHQITANYGIKNHNVEIGLGATYITEQEDKNYVLYPTIGYRFQPIKSKFTFRVYGCLPINHSIDNLFWEKGYITFMPVGINLGISF